MEGRITRNRRKNLPLRNAAVVFVALAAAVLWLRAARCGALDNNTAVPQAGPVDLLQGKVPESERKGLIGPIRPRAFAPASTGKLAAVGYYSAAGTSVTARLLILGVKGSNVLQPVAEEVNTRINEIHWSPDETRISYVACTLDRRSAKPDSENHLVVVNVLAGEKTTVATDISSPQWSRDGESLLYFKHDGLKWRPCSAALNTVDGGKSVIRPKYQSIPLSQETFDHPGAFSHDGARFAIYDKDARGIRIVARRAPSSAAKLIMLADAGPAPQNPRLQWSPDGLCLLFHGIVTNLEYADDVSHVVDVATSTVISMDETISTRFTDLPSTPMARRNPYEVQAVALSWRPGNAHQILVWAEHPRFSATGTQDIGRGTDKWLLYSPGSETWQDAKGLDYTDSSGRSHSMDEDIGFPLLPFSSWHSVEISWSRDGQEVLVNGNAFRFDR